MRRKTKFRGVWGLGGKRYEVMAWWLCPKTGAERKLRRQIEAKSPADADRQRNALRDEQVAGAVKPERVRLEAAVRSWLSTKLASWKASTRKNHASILDAHVVPSLGSFYVDAITHDDVVRWRDSLKRVPKDGEAHPKPLSPDSKNSVLRLLRQVLADVCGPLGIPSPAERVPSVRVRLDESRAVHYLDAGEARAVLEWLRLSTHAHWYPLVATLALTGLRFGEATALRWTDLDDGWIRVRRAQWKGAVDHPKSRVGRRDVPLAPELVATLEAHRQARKRIDPYVFVGRTGKLLHNSVLSKPMRAALTACKVNGRFPAAHGWRKVHSNLLRQVTDEAVRQALIGHADAEVGREHYTRVSDDEKRSASAKVVRLVTGGGA